MLDRSASPQATRTSVAGCALLEQALREVTSLRPGMKRSDVEKNFDRSGGLLFQNKTTYVYRRCRLISVQVNFNLAPSANPDFSPDDIITNVSPLTIQDEAAA